MVTTCPKKEPAFKMPTRVQMPSVGERHAAVSDARRTGKIKAGVASTLLYHLAFECLQELRWTTWSICSLVEDVAFSEERLPELVSWWNQEVEKSIARARQALGIVRVTRSYICTDGCGVLDHPCEHRERYEQLKALPDAPPVGIFDEIPDGEPEPSRFTLRSVPFDEHCAVERG